LNVKALLPSLARRWASSLPLRPLDNGTIRSIVIVELTRLGDVISGIPAIVAFQKAFPEARIEIVVRATFSKLLNQLLPSVRIRSVQDRLTIGTLVRAIAQLRRRPFDLAVSLSPSAANGITSLMSGSPMIAGYLECVGSITPFLRHNLVESFGISGTAPRVYHDSPLSTRSLEVCRLLNIESPSSFPTLSIDGGLPDALTGLAGEQFVVIHPFAIAASRVWPEGTLHATIERMKEEFPYSICVLGRDEDFSQMERLSDRWNHEERVKFYRSADLVTTARIIASASLFIGTDSGPLHLAAALGVPTIGLYGAADPAITNPAWWDAARSASIYHRLPCSPCAEGICIRPSVECMEAIGPSEIIDAVHRLSLPGLRRGTVRHA